MEKQELTPRQQREKDFHEQYSNFTETQNNTEMDFSCVESLINNLERRSWNDYWFIQQQILDQLTGNNEARILDFGCGEGHYALVYAKMGYQVEAFDICESYVQKATNLAAKYNLSDKIHIKQGVAEKLDYPSNQFDVIAGIDILHHVSITQAISECYRVLKPGGVAFFREPIESSIFDKLRNTPFVKKMYPKSASFEYYMTEDEKKLSRQELDEIIKHFPESKIYYYRFFTRIDKFNAGSKMVHFAQKLDHILSAIGPIKSLYGAVVLQLKKPLK